MSETEEISTEEILTSIRNILLEKKEVVSKENVLELTKEMIYKKSCKVDYNKVADEILSQYATVFKLEENKNKEQKSQESEKTEE